VDSTQVHDHYRLHCVVCVHSTQYSAFVLQPRQREWVLHDDTAMRNVGGWGEVVRWCCAGRMQPLLLAYEGRYN
jgi:hypothetical protein